MAKSCLPVLSALSSLCKRKENETVLCLVSTANPESWPASGQTQPVLLQFRLRLKGSSSMPLYEICMGLLWHLKRFLLPYSHVIIFRSIAKHTVKRDLVSLCLTDISSVHKIGVCAWHLQNHSSECTLMNIRNWPFISSFLKLHNYSLLLFFSLISL